MLSRKSQTKKLHLLSDLKKYLFYHKDKTKFVLTIKIFDTVQLLTKHL